MADDKDWIDEKRISYYTQSKNMERMEEIQKEKI